MSWRNIIFILFSNLFKLMAPNARFLVADDAFTTATTIDDVVDQ